MMMLISSIGTVIMLLLSWKLLSYLLYLLIHNHTRRQPPSRAPAPRHRNPGITLLLGHNLYSPVSAENPDSLIPAPSLNNRRLWTVTLWCCPNERRGGRECTRCRGIALQTHQDSESSDPPEGGCTRIKPRRCRAGTVAKCLLLRDAGTRETSILLYEVASPGYASVFSCAATVS